MYMNGKTYYITLQCVEDLICAYMRGANSMHRGNHRMEKKDGVYYFYYHDTAICIVNTKTGEVEYDNGGYVTTSTYRALSDYHHYFGGYCQYFDPVEEVVFANKEPTIERGYAVFELDNVLSLETFTSFHATRKIKSKNPKVISDLKFCKRLDGKAFVTFHFTTSGACIVDDVSTEEQNNYEVQTLKCNTNVKHIA